MPAETILPGENPPPLGFPQPPGAARGAPVIRPRPLPRRPKGRWFVGILLLAVCAVAGYQVWDTFFRYQAFGIVSGRVLTLSSPWDGAITSFQVREGDRVRQGQTLAAVDNQELQQRLTQLGDEVQIARANLDAETARLKWQLALNLDQNRGAEVMFYEAWGQLLQETARLEDLRRNHLERAYRLEATRAIAPEEVDQIKYSIEGLDQKIVKSKEALAGLKRRAAQATFLLSEGSVSEGGTAQLRPYVVRIEALLAEQGRLRERLDQGLVRSPVNGLILKTHRFAGERCQTAGPLLTVLEEGSLEVVLFLPQERSDRWTVGAELEVVVEPYPQAVPCRVERLGEQFEPAPEAIKRRYSEGQRLLPLHLKPTDDMQHYLGLRAGGVVKFPITLSSFWRGGGR